MKQRLLLVEDEAPIRTMLRMLFEDEGFEIREAVSGGDALACWEQVEPSLVLLDLRLPDIHGFDVLRELRRKSDVPVVIVSAHVDSHDVVAGLEAGADDYVTKPFVSKELIARVRATLRRSSTQPASDEQAMSFGSLEIRPAEGIVRLNETALQLTKTEFQLLCEFAEHAGQVLSREQLLERVWGYDYLGDSRLVDAHVRRLRAKIEEDAAHPTRVVTVRGLGYRFERGDEPESSGFR